MPTSRRGEGDGGEQVRNTGQVCISPTRFLVQEGVYDAFVDAFVADAKRLKVGNGLESGVNMGALANPRRIKAMEANLEDASKHGAKVKTGGHRSATRATSRSRPSSPSCRTTPRR